MIGQTVSHYKILEKLGEGGMGEVYLAEDLNLGRKVAIKFLSADKAADPEARKRFVHESKAQAMLSHPNIATFLDAGEERDKAFIVMEYIEGQPLSHLFPSEKLSPSEILNLAVQLAEGLAAAHEKGVVHRDIKPENVLVTSKHRVKITDFGIAKWKGVTTLTQTGARVGTAGYMSPEQVEGKKTDIRTDVFSFGVVLYELVCGRLPFEGPTEAALFYELLHTQPYPLARYCGKTLPEDLERIVFKCLEKKPEERYPSASDLLVDLKKLQKTLDDFPARHGPKEALHYRRGLKIAASIALLIVAVAAAYWGFSQRRTPKAPESSLPRKKLVVLPFRNFGSPQEEYFADGVTDEITTSLAKISGLGVISNTSAFRYKNTQKGLREIGKELGADYALEGSIRWERTEPINRIKVNPQLIRVKDDTHLWAESYELPLDKIFSVQAEIAQRVAQALDVALLEPERNLLVSKPTNNLKAYEYYLQGNLYFLNRSWGKKDLEIAVRMYEKAVEEDRSFALAYARLAMVQARCYFEFDRTEKRLYLARKALNQAFELDPRLPDAHLAAGYYYYWGFLDYERALKEFALAQRQLPNHSDLLWAVALVQRRQGLWSQAVVNFVRAFDLDPGSERKAEETGRTLFRIRKYREAENYLDQAISLAPDLPDPYIFKAWLYVNREGNPRKAIRIIEEAGKKVDPIQLSSARVIFHTLEGNFQMALKQLRGPEIFEYSYAFKYVSTKATYFLAKAKIYELQKQPRLKLACYDSARLLLEKEVKKDSLNAFARSDLGIAYAGLNLKNEAIREGEKAVEILPIPKDAIQGPNLRINLAQIYTMVGETDKAMLELEYLLSIPSWISIALIHTDPVWAPLRAHPRFKKLAKSSWPSPCCTTFISV